MEANTGTAMTPPTPGQGSVVASLKRNVLWGVLGLVALVFATVCVMYYTSRQSEAATPAETTPAAITPAEATSQEAALDALGSTPTAPVAGAPAPAPLAPVAGPAAPGTPAVTEVLPTGKAPAVAGSTPAADKSTVKVTDKAAAKTTEKPVAKTTEKSVAKPAEKAAPAKTLDANSLPHGTKIYVVKSGDTMEKIARTVCGDAHKTARLIELNKDYVKDPTHLKIGQKILVEQTINPRDYADY
ncbi:MAG TPA: LysM domain-containing protein [Planctomycetota bacterium]|nr:LysM domain-containing protein [Planctomycetota bacterium]